MTDFFNYNKILKDRVIKMETGYIIGSLYHLQNKGYPAFIEEGSSKIYGEILTIDDFEDILTQMDMLENFQEGLEEENEYNRKYVEVSYTQHNQQENLGVYVYNSTSRKNAEDIMTPIPHGNWRAFMEERNKGHKEAI